MNTVQRIAKNTAAFIIANIAPNIINFFFITYVARYLGAEGFGILAFALAFTAIFGVFADIGLSTLTIREVARDKSLAPKYLRNIAILKVILVIATFGLISLTINLLGHPGQTIMVVYLIALSVLLDAFSQMFYSIFQAYERMEFYTAGWILRSALLLAGALFAISRGLDVTAFALLYLIASLATLAYNSILSIWKFAKPKVEIDFGFWKQTLKQAWPFGLVVTFVNIYYWVDSVMLSLMKGDEVVGWYNVAYRLVLVLAFIPGAYFSSVFPVMSRFYVSSKGSLKFTYEKSVKYMAILAVPIGVGTTLLAERVIISIFGAEYSHSIIALQILIWSMVFIWVSGVFAQLFNSLNRQTIVAKVTGSCALLNVILNLILIPRYSHIGASTARVATEFTALALVFLWSLRIGYGLSSKKLIDIMAKVVIASAIMGTFIFYLQNLTLWGLVPLSTLLYFIVLYIIRGIDREDRLLLQQLIGRQQAVLKGISTDDK
jgi:O-antigen/teichoic acid export membrane protein